jgi:hypothetical protein
MWVIKADLRWHTAHAGRSLAFEYRDSVEILRAVTANVRTRLRIAMVGRCILIESR